MFAALGAAGLAKLLSTLLGGIVGPIADYYKSRDTQFANIMVASLEAEAQARLAGAQSRVQMLGTRWGAFLLVLIVGPPAAYMGSVYGVTLLETATGIRLEVLSLPARFEQYAVDIIQVFIGGGSLVVAASGVARQWFKK